jgi:hypothetical protein
MQSSSSPASSTLKFERILAVIGTGLCLIVSVLVWLTFSTQQSMWPLPDLYLLEILAASILGVWCLWGDEPELSPLRGILTWVTVGILFAFVIMASFSIGLWFLPVAILFVVAAILADRRKGYNLAVHLGIGLAAAFIQATLMIIIIRLFYA